MDLTNLFEKTPKTKEVEIMLDLETVDLGTNPAIMQIAAVAFCMDTWEVVSFFDILVKHEDGIALGLTQSKETLEWWDKQGAEAKQKVLKGAPRWSTRDALVHFSSWAKSLGYDDYYLWGNGIKADNVWIESAYKAAGVKSPFSYRKDCDYRTVIRLAEKKLGYKIEVDDETLYTAHDAIDDCLRQCEKLGIAWKILNSGFLWILAKRIQLKMERG